jgi:hypothetical protein
MSEKADRLSFGDVWNMITKELPKYADDSTQFERDKIEDAYWYQRGARARYPGADAVLNVTPYVGMAANLDDIQRSVRDEGTVEGGDVAGLALNAATTGAYMKGMKAAPALIKTIAQEVKRASKGKKGHGAVPMLTAGVAMAPVEYVKHYYNAQQEANAKYGDTPVSQIADDLRRKAK